MNYIYSFLLVALLSSHGVFAQSADSQSMPEPVLYPNWTLWVPGATHFYDHRFAEGIIFSSLETGGIILGIAYRNELKSNSHSPYYNYPLLLGMQAFNVDKCDFLRNRLIYLKYKDSKFRFDPIEFNQLMLAPFKPKNIFTPVTGLFVAAAMVQLYIGNHNAEHSFNEVDGMFFMDRYIDRNPSTAVFGTTSLAASFGAGVAEEYWFRNGMMPLYEYRYGKRKGLVISSLMFGAIHFTNVLFSSKPDYGAALLQVAEASAAGFILGWDVQHRNYDIGPAVAAHTWYDFALMLGSFLVDPENNVFGVNVKFVIP